MNVAYVLHGRFPSQKAYGKQVAEVCAAMAALKHKVTLLVPNMRNAFTEEPFAYYGIPKKSFTITTLKHKDATRSWWIPGKLHLRASMTFYKRALKKHFKRHPADVIYLRSPLLLSALLKTKIPLILELHSLPTRGKKGFAKRLKKCATVVCLTKLQRDELVTLGADPKNIVVEPDGVDVERFADMPDAEEMKGEWKLPTDVPVIGYVGQLATRGTIEKGIAELLEAFVMLKSKNVPFYGWIVGGPDANVKEYAESAKAMGLHYLTQFEGHVPPAKIPSVLAACDILVYPAPKSEHEYFTRDTSPLKLFEYLAAGKPVVCADIPPVRQALDEGLVTFVPAGDGEALAKGIRSVIDDLENAQENAQKGMEFADRHGWKKRMQRILKSIKG